VGVVGVRTSLKILVWGVRHPQKANREYHKIALEILMVFENLNTAVQPRRRSLSAMIEAMKTSISYLQSIRNEECFKRLFEDACNLCQKLDLASPHLPWQRRPPQLTIHGSRACNAALVQRSSAEEYFRAQFYAVLDAATSGLQMRHDQPGIARYCDLERVLFETMTADKVHDAVKDYPAVSCQVTHC